MIATLKDRESIHESRGVELIPVSCCIYYESILSQLVFNRMNPGLLLYLLLILSFLT